MSLDEQAAYVLLYCHCWLGFSLPYDYEVLARMCNCTTDKIKKIWPNIKHMFVVKDKQIFCIQAEEERSEQVMNRKKRSMAGKIGAKARWGNGKQS